MSKIELSIKAAYLPGWSLYEGIRELLQNARDAEVQDDAKMSVKHVYRIRDKRPIGALVISNDGTTIPKESFLIGHTTKLGRNDLAGQYGEGFKLACLVLLRLGLDIKIRNGSETWVPEISRSDKFNADVLKFDITGGHKYEDRVQIEVLGVELDQWEEIKTKFLFLNPPVEQSVINVYKGRVLIGPEHQGNLYVKGMFVCHDSALYFGYDAENADIDRDRRMISDQSELTSGLLGAALISGKLTDKVYELLHEGSREVSSLHYFVGASEQDAIAKKFLSQYGEDALPCNDEDEVAELGHLGKRGIKVPYQLRSILQTKLGSTQENIRKMRMGEKHTYFPEELTEDERLKFTRAVELLGNALERAGMDVTLAVRIHVVDFGDINLRGTFHPDDCSIRVARHQLVDTSKVLRVIVHEAAHMLGRDGTKQHEEAIGKLTEALFKKLLGE